jgi:hypothetical protein
MALLPSQWYYRAIHATCTSTRRRKARDSFASLCAPHSYNTHTDTRAAMGLRATSGRMSGRTSWHARTAHDARAGAHCIVGMYQLDIYAFQEEIRTQEEKEKCWCDIVHCGFLSQKISAPALQMTVTIGVHRCNHRRIVRESRSAGEERRAERTRGGAGCCAGWHSSGRGCTAVGVEVEVQPWGWKWKCKRKWKWKWPPASTSVCTAHGSNH